MLKLIRNVLGAIIVFFDIITRGFKTKRTTSEQERINQELKSLSIYQFTLCPFCTKTRRALYKMNLPIELRDAKNDPHFRSELEEKGGKIKVPCLRIEENDTVKWMYESNDIIHYLKHRFMKTAS